MTATLTDGLQDLLVRVAAPHPGDDTLIDDLVAGVRPGGDGAAAALDHDAVRAADPLGLDRVLRQLPAANRAGDVAIITGWLQDAADRGSAGWSMENATAALRDAGMLLGSLRRAGVEPLSAVPAMEPLLIAWATTTGMVPRDTVVHYGLWNPTGERERRFVDVGPQEGALIQSVRFSCRVLPLAGAALDLAWRHGVTSADGSAALAAVRDAVSAFAAEFTRVRGIVDPHFFIEQLRPFFEPVSVGGAVLNGPAAAFIPLYLVDELLWGGGEALSAVHHEALLYGRPLWRAAYQRVVDRRPVVAWLEEQETRGSSPELTVALDLADAAVRSLLRFRGQHVTTARAAYTGADRRFEHGSGGFAPDDLKQVVDEERQAATALRASHLHASEHDTAGPR